MVEQQQQIKYDPSAEFTCIHYEEEFEELKCIGRGNFGAAFLVRAKNIPQNEQCHFIAKKIVLMQLSPKEQEGALLEAQLLKNLVHPNIVSYKTSFIDKGVLIIVMEFCEMGDLAFHVKKKRQKEDHFSETEIMNWFVQLCLSLEYIHGRKILHRDLKSQNVFLTSNNTVKLGDFGISKVLENTSDQALTVQGTPYYMSPEVCQSKPYNYTSDVWSLGCILYELCTLKHAFMSENLLGLVFKIVQDKQEPIPEIYSQDMKNLVACLLQKDESKRPQVIDILRMEFVKTHMRAFVESKGANNLNPNLSVKKQIQPSQAIKDAQLQQKDQNTLTAAERARLRKEQRNREEFDRLKNAAQEQYQNSLRAHDMKQQQFHGGSIRSSTGGGSSFNDTFNNRTMTDKGGSKIFDDQGSQKASKTEYNKPFIDNHKSTNKDYLRNQADINISLSSTQQMEDQMNNQYQKPAETTNPKFEGTLESDRSELMMSLSNASNVMKQSMLASLRQVEQTSTEQLEQTLAQIQKVDSGTLCSSLRRLNVNQGTGSSQTYALSQSSGGNTDAGDLLLCSLMSLSQSDQSLFLSRHFPKEKDRFHSVLSPISEKSSQNDTHTDHFSTIQTSKSISNEEVKINTNLQNRKPASNASPFVSEDRPITGKGEYDIDGYEYDYNEYSDDFESESDDESGSTARSASTATTETKKKAQAQLNAVVDFYARALEESTASLANYDMEGTVKYMGNTTDTVKSLAASPSIPIITAENSKGIVSMSERQQQQKQLIESKMGSAIYAKVYKLLKMHKNNDSEYTVIRGDVEKITAKNHQLKDLCFALEQIVFMETD